MKYFVIFIFTCIFTLIHGETASLEERLSSLEKEIQRLSEVKREVQKRRGDVHKLHEVGTKQDVRLAKVESRPAICSKLVF